MADTQNILLEFYKTTLDYRARVISILFASGIAVAIPNIVTFIDNNQKAHNDILKIDQERDLKDKEIKIKELELKLAAADKHQNYIGQFINQAIDKDIELRIRFAEYFATVSDEPERWERFLANLVRRRDEFEAKLQTLAGEQQKDSPDDARLSLAAEVDKLERQVHSTQQPADQRSRFSSELHRLSLNRAAEVLGRPVKEVKKGSECQAPDNEQFKQLLQGETIDGNFSVVLLKPAIESLKRIPDEIGQDEPELRKSISGAEGLCIRDEAGTLRLGLHSFGTAIDIAIDGQFVPKGISGTSVVAGKLRRISDYFEHAGWTWGGRDVRPDPGHFEVGRELFEQWVHVGAMRPLSKAEAANR